MAARTEVNPNVDVKLVAWTLTTADPNGDAFVAPDFPDKCVVVRGTFGGATLTLQGANVEGTPATAAWQTLNDPQGNALTFTAARIEQLLENPYQLRPVLTGGGGTTSVLVELLAGKVTPGVRTWNR